MFNIILESLVGEIVHQKEKKQKIGKEEEKSSLFAGDMLCYVENPEIPQKYY